MQYRFPGCKVLLPCHNVWSSSSLDVENTIESGQGNLVVVTKNYSAIANRCCWLRELNKLLSPDIWQAGFQHSLNLCCHLQEEKIHSIENSQFQVSDESGLVFFEPMQWHLGTFQTNEHLTLPESQEREIGEILKSSVLCQEIPYWTERWPKGHLWTTPCTYSRAMFVSVRKCNLWLWPAWDSTWYWLCSGQQK